LVRSYHVFMSFDSLKVFSDFNLTQSIGVKAFFSHQHKIFPFCLVKNGFYHERSALLNFIEGVSLILGSRFKRRFKRSPSIHQLCSLVESWTWRPKWIKSRPYSKCFSPISLVFVPLQLKTLPDLIRSRRTNTL